MPSCIVEFVAFKLGPPIILDHASLIQVVSQTVILAKDFEYELLGLIASLLNQKSDFLFSLRFTLVMSRFKLYRFNLAPNLA